MKKEMKAVYFTVGLLLGLALIVVGIVRIVTSDATQLKSRSEAELRSSISSLSAEVETLRAAENQQTELAQKEAELMDTEEELLKVQQGFYSNIQRMAWLQSIPFLIAGIFAIAVAVVVYHYV